jgi:uncharacterized protein with GYD domain
MRYLIKASYTTEGMRGVMKEGGTGRRAAVQQAAKELGGSVESFYFAFGDTDAYVVCELPDNKTAAAFAMTVGASGLVGVETSVLLTPEEVDDAAQISVNYRAPGK